MKKYLRTFKDKWRSLGVIIFFVGLWFVLGALLYIKGSQSYEDIFLGAAYASGITLFTDLTIGVGRESTWWFISNKK